MLPFFHFFSFSISILIAWCIQVEKQHSLNAKVKLDWNFFLKKGWKRTCRFFTQVLAFIGYARLALVCLCILSAWKFNSVSSSDFRYARLHSYSIYALWFFSASCSFLSLSLSLDAFSLFSFIFALPFRKMERKKTFICLLKTKMHTSCNSRAVFCSYLFIIETTV